MKARDLTTLFISFTNSCAAFYQNMLDSRIGDGIGGNQEQIRILQEPEFKQLKAIGLGFENLEGVRCSTSSITSIAFGERESTIQPGSVCTSDEQILPTPTFTDAS